MSGELRDILLDALARDSSADVVVKAGAVERLSTACVQVILVAADGFKAAARRLEVENPSSAFSDAFERLGLAPDLQKLI
ncbi:hypothetical protein A6A04_12495 [Paramagnetospirillum marisnigri]|uniref:STAS domain-containing protein n=2 Tax=Paramagnetospirillum marisnigri TaxID=1285242 RepID=A0A178MX39_9PROT|nr:hypothetical protein A6A04_12495 [Paramagnetospirillum marisnigri]